MIRIEAQSTFVSVVETESLSSSSWSAAKYLRAGYLREDLFGDFLGDDDDR